MAAPPPPRDIDAMIREGHETQRSLPLYANNKAKRTRPPALRVALEICAYRLRRRTCATVHGGLTNRFEPLRPPPSPPGHMQTHAPETCRNPSVLESCLLLRVTPPRREGEVHARGELSWEQFELRRRLFPFPPLLRPANRGLGGGGTVSSNQRCGKGGVHPGGGFSGVRRGLPDVEGRRGDGNGGVFVLVVGIGRRARGGAHRSER